MKYKTVPSQIYFEQLLPLYLQLYSLIALISSNPSSDLELIILLRKTLHFGVSKTIVNGSILNLPVTLKIFKFVCTALYLGAASIIYNLSLIHI